ncbi:MAG TPA: 4-alpha-glucanotransferase [Kofleriaceae bacterium]|nr:4-alpha-glucanotransferase [Kofleriaceae bacterium]
MSIADKLERLGVKRLLLAIHDVSFPSDPDEDIGRGAPSTRAAARLMALAKQLGFTGLQLGPQGQTSRDNPSPYDATIFSRHTATISIGAYRATGLVDEATISRALVTGVGSALHAHAYDASEALLMRAHAAMFLGLRPDLRAELDEFRSANGRWLESDALYAALAIRHDGTAHRDWPSEERELWREHSPLDPFVLGRMEASAALIEETRSRQGHDEGVAGTRDAIARELAALRARIEALKANKDEAAARMLALAGEHAIPIDRYCFGQLLAHREHVRVREVAAGLGLALYGDVQVGYADADAWAYAAAFMASYRMGAPPSRTNPAGQPWGYPVLDPTQRLGRSAALVFARADKGFAEYDGLRLDHPHGLVCPWVYRAGTGDDGQAVRDGARLFESPALDDHPELAALAKVTVDQLDPTQARYADGWVRALEPWQINDYALYFEMLRVAAEQKGRSFGDVSCEVLSTMPFPLGAVLAKYGLGRWRVAQKANLDDPRDVYRMDNAQRPDWVMLGNHDTAPIFALLGEWPAAKREQWARHLAQRLALARPERLASDGFFANAMLAELLASRAENVSIFFADLFGYHERFNMPGVIDKANWSLRLPAEFAQLYDDRRAAGAALDLELAADLALGATA